MVRQPAFHDRYYGKRVLGRLPILQDGVHRLPHLSNVVNAPSHRKTRKNAVTLSRRGLQKRGNAMLPVLACALDRVGPMSLLHLESVFESCILRVRGWHICNTAILSAPLCSTLVNQIEPGLSVGFPYTTSHYDIVTSISILRSSIFPLTISSL